MKECLRTKQRRRGQHWPVHRRSPLLTSVDRWSRIFLLSVNLERWCTSRTTRPKNPSLDCRARSEYNSMGPTIYSSREKHVDLFHSYPSTKIDLLGNGEEKTIHSSTLQNLPLWIGQRLHRGFVILTGDDQLHLCIVNNRRRTDDQEVLPVSSCQHRSDAQWQPTVGRDIDPVDDCSGDSSPPTRRHIGIWTGRSIIYLVSIFSIFVSSIDRQ